MAVFISKEELLGSPAGGAVAKEIGVVPRQAPVNTGGFLDVVLDVVNNSGGTLDKLNQLLGGANQMLENIERIRSNKMVQGLVSAKPAVTPATPASFTAQPQAATTPAAAPLPPPPEHPGEAKPAPAPIAKTVQLIPQPEFNEAGAKELLAEFMAQIDTAGDSTKKLTLAEISEMYKGIISKGVVESVVIANLQANYKRLLK